MDYDEGLFEGLRTLRRRLADALDMPAFVVFSDVSLRTMATAYPIDEESFLRVPGVSDTKLEKYGTEFLAVISNYVERHSITPPPPGAIAASRASRNGAKPKRAARTTESLQETRTLFERKLSLEEMARERGLAESTIASHLERLVEAGEELDISYLLPDADALHEIEKAFAVCGSEQLKPVYEYLEERYSYEQIRLTRIHLRQQGRLPD